MLDEKCSITRLPKIILASGSPRRSEILTSVGWRFEKYTADIDESELEGETAEIYVQRLAKTKAETVAEKFPNEIVLGADTTVVIDNQIIGKPVDLNDARRMLEMLSGNWHEVLTGAALVKNGKSVVGIQSTKVKFVEMSGEEINFLVEKGEPLDKAGAYAVQAQAALFIEKIEGDYWNVVGLPVNLVYGIFKNNFLK
jgi:septum formation protein